MQRDGGRVTEEEIRAAIRVHGFATADVVQAVLLEIDGRSQSTLVDIVGQEDKGQKEQPKARESMDGWPGAAIALPADRAQFLA